MSVTGGPTPRVGVVDDLSVRGRLTVNHPSLGYHWGPHSSGGEGGGED